jgi:hypothetical protein
MVWPESFNPSGPDGWNALSPKMGITGIPTSFLIDRNGVLRDIEVAYLDENLLDRLLDGSGAAQSGSNSPQVRKEVMNQIPGLPPELAAALRAQMAARSPNQPTPSPSGQPAQATQRHASADPDSADPGSAGPGSAGQASTPVQSSAAQTHSADPSPSQSADGTAPPATKPAAPPAATPVDPEKQANAMLSLANSYLGIDRADRAKEKLNELLAKYPNSQAAPKAKELLAQLNSQ